MWNFLLDCQSAKGAQGDAESSSFRIKASVGDIKLFLMAIYGIKGNKRMFVELGESDSIFTTKLSFGWVNN